MASELYQAGIKGLNTQLVPVVKIDDSYYSTNDLSIIVNGERVYCKPIVLNLPFIKDAIDINTKNFIISNITLQLSNAPFAGSRFSDLMATKSMFNKEVVIYYKTQHMDDLELFEVIYTGVTKELNHTKGTISISVESLAETKMRKSLPVNSLGDGPNVPNESKNAKIPMVYGAVDRSPCLVSKEISEDGESLTTALIIDSAKLSSVNTETQNIGTYPVQSGPLYVGEGADYVSVNKFESATGSIAYGDPNYLINYPNNNRVEFDTDGDSGFAKTGSITSMIVRKILSCEIDYNAEDTITAGQSNFKIHQIDTNGQQVGTIFYSDYTQITDGIKQTILDSLVDNISNSGVRISGVIRMDILDDHTETFMMLRFNIEPISISGDSETFLAVKLDVNDDHDGDYRIHPGKETELGQFVDGEQSDVSEYSSIDTWTENIDGYKFRINKYNDEDIENDWNTLDQYDSFRVGIGKIEGQNTDKNVDIEIKQLTVWQNYKIKNVIGNNYFVDVNGRVEESVDNNGATVETFINNPIDIVKHIVENEVQFPNIDQESYEVAKSLHNNWVFAFTIKDEIDSMELIADICRSTKAFPRIDADGNFGFAVIKDSYGEEDYNNATTIQDLEVIEYKFNLSKPEEVVTKCRVLYKKDYSSTKYLAKSQVISDQSYAYYGLEEDDNFLEFASDYIRSAEAVISLRDYLYNNKKNPHLEVEYILPPKYSNVRVGDLIKVDRLHEGIQSHGISYVSCTKRNGQWIYPLFIVTEVSLSLNRVRLKATQLHHLDGLMPVFWNNLGVPLIETDVNEQGAGEPGDTPISGCMDPIADNYNPDATLSDGSCVYQQAPVLGCTNPLAFNYNPEATEDDGTCSFDQSFIYGDASNDGTINVLDIVQIVNYILLNPDESDLEDQQFKQRADVSGDGILNVLDIVNIVNYLLYGESTLLTGQLYDPVGTFNEINVPLITPIDMREGPEGLALRKRLGEQYPEQSWALDMRSPDVNNRGTGMHDLVSSFQNVTEVYESDGIGKNIFLHIPGNWHNQGALNANQLSSGVLIPNVNEDPGTARGSLKFRIDMQFDGEVSILYGNTNNSIPSYYEIDGVRYQGSNPPGTKLLTLSVFNDWSALGLDQDINGFLTTDIPDDEFLFGVSGEGDIAGSNSVNMENIDQYPHLENGLVRVTATLKKGTNILFLHTQDTLYGLGGELSEDNFGGSVNSQYGVNANLLTDNGVPYWWNNESIGTDGIHPNSIDSFCSMYRTAYVGIRYLGPFNNVVRWLSIYQHGQILSRDELLYNNWRNWWWLPESAEGEY